MSRAIYPETSLLTPSHYKSVNSRNKTQSMMYGAKIMRMEKTGKARRNTSKVLETLSRISETNAGLHSPRRNKKRQDKK